MTSIKLLYVEDEPFLGKIVKESLESRHFDVCMVADGAKVMAELAGWYAQGKVKPVIDRTMPMAELKAAYAHMGSRAVKGKLVMVNPH